MIPITVPAVGFGDEFSSTLSTVHCACILSICLLFDFMKGSANHISWDTLLYDGMNGF